MRYPDLVPERVCKIPIAVHLESEGLNELGEPEYVLDLDLRCNFQDHAKTVLTKEKKVVQVSGTAYFHGDIAPQFPTLSGGTVVIFGEERRIVQGMNARSPDSSVNYCMLEVL